MPYAAAKSPKILTIRLMQKYRKNNFEMIALTLLKAGFKFLNAFAE